MPSNKTLFSTSLIMYNRTMILPVSWSFTLPVLMALSFAVPFFIAGPQMLVGIIVNACLFAGFIKSEKLYWSIILFPSLAVLSRGLIFGPMTKYLYFFVPIIWFGNFLLLYVFGKTKHLGNVTSIVIASLAKSALLFMFANIFVSAHITPKLFLTTMGLNQFLTAVIGGLIALCLLPNNRK